MDSLLLAGVPGRCRGLVVFHIGAGGARFYLVAVWDFWRWASTGYSHGRVWEAHGGACTEHVGHHAYHPLVDQLLNFLFGNHAGGGAFGRSGDDFLKVFRQAAAGAIHHGEYEEIFVKAADFEGSVPLEIAPGELRELLEAVASPIWRNTGQEVPWNESR